MKLGFSPIQGDGRYEAALEEVKYADANGLDSVFLQEHHEATVKQWWPDPLTVLTAFAQETDRLDLGTAILLLPLYHPVRVAERGAILDGLSNGRLIFGAAVGYRPREFELMNVPRDRRGDRLEEYLELIARLWTDDQVTFDGEFYSVESLTLTPSPEQTPRPRVWLGGYHRVVLDRAARFISNGLADCWFPGTQPDRQGLAARRAEFEELLTDQETTPVAVDQPLFRDGVIAPSRKEAHELAEQYIVAGYEEQYAGRGHEPSERGDLGHDVLRGEYEPEELLADRFIVGDPEDWLRELTAYEEALGADHVVVRLFFEGMEHTDVMTQLELLCEEVVPKLA